LRLLPLLGVSFVGELLRHLADVAEPALGSFEDLAVRVRQRVADSVVRPNPDEDGESDAQLVAVPESDRMFFLPSSYDREIPPYSSTFSMLSIASALPLDVDPDVLRKLHRDPVLLEDADRRECLALAREDDPIAFAELAHEPKSLFGAAHGVVSLAPCRAAGGSGDPPATRWQGETSGASVRGPCSGNDSGLPPVSVQCATIQRIAMISCSSTGTDRIAREMRPRRVFRDRYGPRSFT